MRVRQVERVRDSTSWPTEWITEAIYSINQGKEDYAEQPVSRSEKRRDYKIRYGLSYIDLEMSAMSASRLAGKGLMHTLTGALNCAPYYIQLN